MVAGILTNEVNLSRIREGYRRKVKEEVDKNQKEYFLREQMKVIRNELGDGASAEEYQEKYKEQNFLSVNQIYLSGRKAVNSIFSLKMI